MSDNASATQTPVFYFSLSPFYAGFRWVVFIGFGAGAILAASAWVRQHNPNQAISFILQVILAVLLWRRVFRALPSSVSIEGPELVFRDIPSYWIDINGLPVPLVIRRQIRIPVSAMVPEWISGTLTWNDMINGKSVFLARGSQAHALAAWLVQQGCPPPVGA